MAGLKNTAENSAPTASADAIHERLESAILEHRIPPGTKLGEDRLADIFGVSRARIRQVLARLCHEQLVEIQPQRGAFVASPTPEEAREVFEARRIIEPALVERLIENFTPAKLRRLQQHLQREAQAREAGDQRAVIRLSGEFHILLAELAGNRPLLRCMRELSALTGLTISLYNAPTSSCCRADEHGLLVEAIQAGNATAATQHMLQHLHLIEASLALSPDDGPVDLERILRL
ncbi:MAG: GntR family transcriptional regulator [Comamonas sp.]